MSVKVAFNLLSSKVFIPFYFVICVQMQEEVKEQPPKSPINLVSIDEIIGEESKALHSETEEIALDMNTMVQRLEDPRSAAVITSITG